MRGIVLKSLLLIILIVAGLFSFKYFLKFSVNSILKLPNEINTTDFSSNTAIADTNIILINIGHLDRKKISETINVISEGSPKVIAFNVCFDKTRKTPYDSLLLSSFQRIRNVVLMNHGENCRCSGNVYYGKEEFPIQEDGVVRTFYTDTSTLSAVIVRLFNDSIYNHFQKRNKKEELINYIGNYNHFLTLNAELVNYRMLPKSIFRNKIILLGYLGSRTPDAGNDPEDTYSTPMGSSQTTKMYGTEISANILHTIIEGKYITVLSALHCSIIYLLILILNSLIGFLALKRSRRIFAACLTLLVIVESCLAAFVMMRFFENNIILNIEELPFVILLGFLTQYFVIRYTVNIEAHNSRG